LLLVACCPFPFALSCLRPFALSPFTPVPSDSDKIIAFQTIFFHFVAKFIQGVKFLRPKYPSKQTKMLNKIDILAACEKKFTMNVIFFLTQ
jgi:hypothetical protein